MNIDIDSLIKAEQKAKEAILEANYIQGLIKDGVEYTDIISILKRLKRKKTIFKKIL